MEPSRASRLHEWSHLTTSMKELKKMADLVFVILTVAFFATAALVVKGVERL